MEKKYSIFSPTLDFDAESPEEEEDCSGSDNSLLASSADDESLNEQAKYTSEFSGTKITLVLS